MSPNRLVTTRLWGLPLTLLNSTGQPPSMCFCRPVISRSGSTVLSVSIRSPWLRSQSSAVRRSAAWWVLPAAGFSLRSTFCMVLGLPRGAARAPPAVFAIGPKSVRHGGKAFSPQRQAASGLAALRVPVALEICDQGGAEVAIGLLARIDGEVGAEHIERLLRDAEGAPVARGAHHARIGQPLDHALDGRVHLAGFDDLVADQPPFRAVAVEPAFVLDRLPRDAV